MTISHNPGYWTEHYYSHEEYNERLALLTPSERARSDKLLADALEHQAHCDLMQASQGLRSLHHGSTVARALRAKQLADQRNMVQSVGCEEASPSPNSLT